MVEFVAYVVVPILAGWKAVELILWGVARLSAKEERGAGAVMRRLTARLSRPRR